MCRFEKGNFWKAVDTLLSKCFACPLRVSIVIAGNKYDRQRQRVFMTVPLYLSLRANIRIITAWRRLATSR